MAASKISLLTLGVTAAVSLSPNRAIAFDGTVAAAGQNMLGVSNTSASVGDRVPVDVQGTTIAVVGEPVTAGQALEVGADGKLVGKADGVLVARAMHAAIADDLVEVLLIAN
jgi:hypothetical protein